jgi:hypothetical protein
MPSKEGAYVGKLEVKEGEERNGEYRFNKIHIFFLYCIT